MGQRLGQVMPIPESISIHVMPEDYDDQRFLSRAYVNLKWCWWPQRCHVSGKWMWLTEAYRAMYVITGPGDPCVWFRWYSNTEYLLLKLKGH